MKILDEQISYAKIVKEFVIEIAPDKVIKVTKWAEDDDMFDQYEADYEIEKNEVMGTLTDEQKEEVIDFINDLSLWASNKEEE